VLEFVSSQNRVERCWTEQDRPKHRTQSLLVGQTILLSGVNRYRAGTFPRTSLAACSRTRSSTFAFRSGGLSPACN
jgi:hypothetical protein